MISAVINVSEWRSTHPLPTRVREISKVKDAAVDDEDLPSLRRFASHLYGNGVARGTE